VYVWCTHVDLVFVLSRRQESLRRPMVRLKTMPPMGRWGRVARWYIFQAKNPNLGKLWSCLAIEVVGIFYVYLVYFTAIWYILWPFGILSCYLVIFFPVLVCCSKNDLAALQWGSREPSASKECLPSTGRNKARFGKWTYVCTLDVTFIQPNIHRILV
jgi:hypothetical protein